MAMSSWFRPKDANVASAPWAVLSVSQARLDLLTTEKHHHDFQDHGLLFIFLCIMSVSRIIKSNPCTFYTRLLWSNNFVWHSSMLVCETGLWLYPYISLYPICLRFYQMCLVAGFFVFTLLDVRTFWLTLDLILFLFYFRIFCRYIFSLSLFSLLSISETHLQICWSFSTCPFSFYCTFPHLFINV